MVRAYRVSAKFRCILVHNGKKYPVTLENISSDGALLTLESVRLPKLRPNVICNVMLCDKPDLSSHKNTCRIARFDFQDRKKLAVQFLDPLEDLGEAPPYSHQLRLQALYKGSQ